MAGFFYAMEFVADKIPYIDSTWDAISTAIRPTAGAVVGVLLAGQADSLNGAVAAVVGGGTALLSHSVKAGARLAINASPEPLSNIGASLTEDAAVLAVVWFAIDHPRAAAAIAAVLLAGGLVLLYLLARSSAAAGGGGRARRPSPPAARSPRRRQTALATPSRSIARRPLSGCCRGARNFLPPLPTSTGAPTGHPPNPHPARPRVRPWHGWW